MKYRVVVFAILAGMFLSSCAGTRSAVSAEEYYSLGMAYFDMGNYTEAEKWLLRARSVDKTKTASEYQLGRIAFENGRYGEAAELFESILEQDQENTMLLKSAAYANIYAGNPEKARSQYERLLKLVPGSRDAEYNYALVLYVLEAYEDAEFVLKSIPLDSDPEALLLMARTQKKLNRVEAVDSYALWLEQDETAPVLVEYAEAAEQSEFYVRAIEAYRKLLSMSLPDKMEPGFHEIKSRLAMLLLIADPEDTEAFTLVEEILDDSGDKEELRNFFMGDDRISESNRQKIQDLIEEHRMPQNEEETES